jgi:chromosome segregation protein
MLKALELNGFKSFADKTRFEFPPGITVVVGPNGSGKSNVVDAIKWVLGEQSAKSLRGKEMADVIFKGGGSGGRKPLNTAEATIVFENEDGRLPIDAPEVHVTRRVYRSGEGEYLVNNRPCRLRDIKDLFSGTGVGADAYSLIEQGKVDMLLMASSRERRAILEEAAGISRFKAKRLEAQRRLARVDQNLLRLSDIVEEVDGRLRSIRSQASKARRYQEYSKRLQELRTQTSRVDARRLGAQLKELEAELEELAQCGEQFGQRIEEVEAEAARFEDVAEQCNEAMHRIEGQIAGTRESIASCESSMRHERRLADELDEEISRRRNELMMLRVRSDEFHAQLRETQSAFDGAKAEHREIEGRIAAHQGDLDRVSLQIETRRQEAEQRRERQVDLMREKTRLSNLITGIKERLSAISDSATRNRQRLRDAERNCRLLEDDLGDVRSELGKLSAAAQGRRSALKEAESKAVECEHELEDRRRAHQDLQARRKGAEERVVVLADLEKRREGVAHGARTLLEQARRDPSGPLAKVRGLVADLVSVGVEMAARIDTALGDAAQYVVVADRSLHDRISDESFPLVEQVALILLDETDESDGDELLDLDGCEGVIGRADRFVHTDNNCGKLIRRLLGDTWFVEDLRHAFVLRRWTGARARFVTNDAVLVERDGAIVVGAKAESAGLVARRSHLQVLREQLGHLKADEDALRQDVAKLDEMHARCRGEVDIRFRESRQAADALAEQRVKMHAAEGRCKEASEHRIAVAAEMQAVDTDVRGSEEQLVAHHRQLKEVDVDIATLEGRIRSDAEIVGRLEGERKHLIRRVTDTRVELAKSEQRLEGLRDSKSRFEQHQRDRDRALGEARRQLELSTTRRDNAHRSILRGASQLAELYLRKESRDHEVVECMRQREAAGRQRTQLLAEQQRLRREAKKVDDTRHRKDLEVGEVRHALQNLADRLREDYGLELSDLDTETDEQEVEEREAVEQEIDSLRRKITNIGAVNVDALNELDELEQRYNSLAGQYRDLTSAKDSLERIINKINGDSRRLFTETLETVRANFQILFRKVFGGGRADIVLEDENDPLESGVEIIATPPGKNSLSISLLSGGERALTAVTLLLALFQYRPSPFCVLDEVDGPLDESNIGRFVGVLKDFLKWTRFVVVTHSKKTMTAANTLYGVTMQESGISKRVSVQFEDVSDTGHISQEAVAREEDEDEQAA